MISSQTTSYADTIPLVAGKSTLAHSRKADQSQRLEESCPPPVAQMSSEQIGEHYSFLNKAQEHIDRLRYPEVLPDLARSAAPAGKPEIHPERSKITEEYDEETRELNKNRGDAMHTAGLIGSKGHHSYPLTFTVTNDQGRIRVVQFNEQSKETVTREYDERDESYSKYSEDSSRGHYSKEKQGKKITIREFSGDVHTYEPSHSGITKSTVRKSDRSLHNSGTGNIENSRGGNGIPVTDTHSPVSREFLEDFVKRHSYRIDADGTHHPISEKALNNYVKGLECYDRGTLERLEKEGVSFACVDPTKTPKGGYPGGLKKWLRGPDGSPSTAYYTYRDKIVVLQEDTEKDTVTHEVGHAIDDSLEKDTSSSSRGIRYRSEKDPVLKSLYTTFKKRHEEGAETWSEYALSNKMEYMATAIEWYNSPHLKAAFKRKDPEMYAYTEKLLKESAQ